jgi:hypothetical protein
MTLLLNSALSSDEQQHTSGLVLLFVCFFFV